MKIDTTPQDDHQVKLTVEVEPKQFEESKQRAARKLARQVKIPGFRPGKAPYPVIVRHIGEPAITEEAIEILANDVYPLAVKEAQINAYGPGYLDNIVSIDPPTFEFVVPLKAEVALGDYRAIRREFTPEPISEERVEEVLNNLRERNAIIEPVERAAEERDLIHVTLRADWKNPKENESDSLIGERKYTAVIETEEPGNPSEWPFPGFSRRLLGHSKGDELVFPYTFPEDEENGPMSGEEAEFTVKIDQVNSRSMPEMDEEFAKSMGDYATIEELRSEIRKDLEEGSLNQYREDFDDAVLEEVVAGSTIKYPPQMLNQEVDTVFHRLENSLSQQNLDIELYLKMRQMDMDGLREELKPVAETRLKKTLVLLEIAEVEKINVAPQDLQNETNRTLSEISSYMQEKDFRSLIGSEESRSNLVGSIMMDMLISKTKERLREYAQGFEPSQAVPEEAPQADAAETTGEASELQTEQLPEDAAVQDATAQMEEGAGSGSSSGEEDTASSGLENPVT